LLTTISGFTAGEIPVLLLAYGVGAVLGLGPAERAWLSPFTVRDRCRRGGAGLVR